MPVRIYDIARKLGIESTQVLAKARALGIGTARVPSSSLDKITAEHLVCQLRCDLEAAFRRGFQGLALGNFKAFADTQNVPIKPLTLIFGANSSGKSSVLHGLLLAQHAVDTGQLDVSKTEIGGDCVDMGGFRQYVYRSDATRRVELVLELDNRNLRGNAFRLMQKHCSTKVTLTFGVPLDNLGQPERGQLPHLVSYEVESGGRSVIRLSRRPDRTMQLDRLDEEALQFLSNAVLLSNTTTETISSEIDKATVQNAAKALVSRVRFTCHRLLPNKILLDARDSGNQVSLFPVDRANRPEKLELATQQFMPGGIAELVSGINVALESQLNRITYLGPLRSFPPRHLAFIEDTGPNWRPGGGYAWDMVRRDSNLRSKVNDWLSLPERMKTPYRLTVERLFTASDTESVLEQALSSIAVDLARERREAMDTGTITDDQMSFPFDALGSPEQVKQVLHAIRERSESNPMDELILIDCRTNTRVTHRDVGIGVSQVLPVLVHAYADKGEIVVIEQPEIHLHPALQAELGDVFIESALGECQNTFLLETHSEHLILRILRRVRETTENKLPKEATPIRPEDISVMFVEPTEKGSIIRHLPVTPDGDFSVPWPGGFFADRLQELP